jgi:hypothetical protein
MEEGMSKIGLVIALTISFGAAVVAAGAASVAKTILDTVVSASVMPAPSGTLAASVRVRLAQRGSFGPPPASSSRKSSGPKAAKRKAKAKAKKATKATSAAGKPASSSWAADSLTAPDTGETK